MIRAEIQKVGFIFGIIFKIARLHSYRGKRRVYFYLRRFNFFSVRKLPYFPEGWKHAKVDPIPKPREDLLSVANLLLINKHASAHGILPDEQFDFRHNHSADHQLTRFIKSVKGSLWGKNR